jgi:hypothetical protein
MSKRQSDQSEMEYRRAVSRTFERGGKWFFSSREGEIGPFDSEADAEEDMDGYVMLIDLREENESSVTPD